MLCVSIGLEEAGELIAGVIYQPVTQELFTAAKGEGAYLNQKRIHVSTIDRLATSLLATGFPSVKRARNPNIHYYWDFTLRSHGVRRDGSAALDLASVACGRFDGFWEFGLHSWDTAAGVFLVREAGGMVTIFSGQPYSPRRPRDAGVERAHPRRDAPARRGYRRARGSPARGSLELGS